MRTGNPTKRVAGRIACVIGGGLLNNPASMFAIDRDGGVYDGLAMTIMARTDASDMFFIAIEL